MSDYTEMQDRFRAHPVTAEQAEELDDLRYQFERVAGYIVNLYGPSRSISSALTKLEEAQMHAVKGAVQEMKQRD